MRRFGIFDGLFFRTTDFLGFTSHFGSQNIEKTQGKTFFRMNPQKTPWQEQSKRGKPNRSTA